MKIEVLDSIMGSGKSTGIIKWMVDNPQNKYLYVSPLLTEVVERIPSECEGLEFESPNTNNHRTKGEHLTELLKSGCNISFTHALFTSLTNEHLSLIKREVYTLIIDEEIDFVEAYKGTDYKKEDIITLEKSGHIRINEDELGRVYWTWDVDSFEEGSKYSKLKRMCDLGMVHCAKRDRGMIVLHLPIGLVLAASRTIVLTYLFECSVMSLFMEMKCVSVVPFTDVKLIKTVAQVKEEASRLIKLCDTPSTIKLRDSGKYSLSTNFYNNATKEELRNVSNAILSACRKYDRDQVIYTLPKHMVITKGAAPIRVRGFPSDTCFLFASAKATNDYAHKNVVVHAFNRHPMVSLVAYLQDYGFPLDRDEYAISEMVQFIWRSSIRKGEEIHLYILSKRMLNLFKSWLDYN